MHNLFAMARCEPMLLGLQRCVEQLGEGFKEP